VKSELLTPRAAIFQWFELKCGSPANFPEPNLPWRRRQIPGSMESLDVRLSTCSTAANPSGTEGRDCGHGRCQSSEYHSLV